MTLPPQPLCIGARVSGEPVVLEPDERRRHPYIIGQTGTGKSTLLPNLIRQDLIAGEGLALLDPHGDLAEAALAYIPRARTNDLVYINPADLERPIGFNPLSRVPDDLKPIVADDTVSAFRHVWPESWGPRMDYILLNAVRALLDVPGATLLMLPRLLIDEPFRAQLVDRHVRDPVVRSFWVNQYAGYNDNFRTEVVAPIQNKIGKALMIPSLRNMLAQPKSTITLRRVMDEGAIVICNLSKGKLGESTAHLLGAILTTTFAQAALSRANTPAAKRRAFHLYADEFQSFATESFALILSKARKYALTLTMPTNTSTSSPMICGPRFSATSDRSSPAALERRTLPSSPIRLDLYDAPQARRQSVHRLIETSRAQFGRPRAEVEARISKFLGVA